MKLTIKNIFPLLINISMNIQELHSFKLSDAVKFHDTLNPKLWSDTQLRSDVAQQLKKIADDFIDELGLSELEVKDITVSGSNAAYSYTDHSDLDLHILIDMSKLNNDEIYRELFNAKKVIYNDSHDIKIYDIPVELYVQDSNEPVKSLGEYSILNDRWIKIPSKRRANFDQRATKEKFEKLASLIKYALRYKKLDTVKNIISKIKQYRQAGLEHGGEFGPENLAYKALRSRGYIDKLYDLRNNLHSRDLSIPETDIALESASGYIPSEKEKNDPRFKTALTVDVKPDSIKQNAIKLGLGTIKRSGVPQTARSNGSFSKTHTK